jgi:N-acetylmuramoyl-L-alanine amidase
MFGRRSRVRRTLRNGVAWLGLILMAVSGAWWEWTAKPSAPRSTETRGPQESAPVVVIDPGHGGQDSGAMCAGMLEKDLTLDVAQRIDRLLQAQGVPTVLTRVGDAYVALPDRAALTNRVPHCVLVSIHFNEDNKAVSSGIETYYAEHQMSPGPALASWLPFWQRAVTQDPNLESQSLAGFIQQELVARTQALNRGTKPKQFFVITNVRHPAVLIEGGFLTNKEDMAKITNPEYREQMAIAIAEGVLRYRELVKTRPGTLAVSASGGAE